MDYISGFQHRKQSPTEIKYLFISRPLDIFSYFLPPLEFENNHILEFLQFCPKDMLQLVNPIQYQEYCYKFCWNNPLNFSILYDINVNRYLEKAFSAQGVKLIMIDGKSLLLNDIVEMLKVQHQPTHFYYVEGVKDPQRFGLPNLVQSALEFNSNLVFGKVRLMLLLGQEADVAPAVSSNFRKQIVDISFVGGKANYRMINCLIGNFSFAEGDKEYSTVYNAYQGEGNLVEFGGQAIKNPNTFDRQLEVVNQIERLDSLLFNGQKEQVLAKDAANPLFAPLILVAPFYSPDLSKIFETDDPIIKKMMALSLIEQDSNYTNNHKQSTRFDTLELKAYISMQTSIIRYLDQVAFLHATNCFSPVVRLPFKGKSINRELSFFRTDTFKGFGKVGTRVGFKKNIKRFGENYKKLCISPELENEIVLKNRQIILITDLPLEWLAFKGVPFAFSHDICRLPIVGFRPLMVNYATNKRFKYTIPSDILHKTLVIYGSSEPKFQKWQRICDDFAKDKGFVAVRCHCVADVVATMKQHRPDFVIFDCHGDYDVASKSTFLYIGNERLTGESILDNRLHAPLIFLSACGTAPTYGTINPIANAFFQTGCLAVTATYLPVEINSSSVLYLSLLLHLGSAALMGTHKNWLAFVSHVIRSSYITSIYKPAIKKTGEKLYEDLWKKCKHGMTDALYFERRRMLYKNLDQDIEMFTDLDKRTFENVIPEYLFYSNLGRSDLIYFESWLEQFGEKNAVE